MEWICKEWQSFIIIYSFLHYLEITSRVSGIWLIIFKTASCTIQVRFKIKKLNKARPSSRWPPAALTFEGTVPTNSCCGKPPPPWTQSRASCRCWRRGCPRCPPPGCSPSWGTIGTYRRRSSASPNEICRWKGRTLSRQGWWTRGRRGRGAYNSDRRQRTRQTSSPCPSSIPARTTWSRASSPSPLAESSPRSHRGGSSRWEVQSLHHQRPPRRPGQWHCSGQRLRAGERLLPPWSQRWWVAVDLVDLQQFFVDITASEKNYWSKYEWFTQCGH